MKTNYSALLVAAGRVLLASLFILGGLNKLNSYAATLELMKTHGLEPASLLLPATIVLELAAGIVIASGRRGVGSAGVTLAVFTVMTNIFFHDFWNAETEMRATQMSLFVKNVAIAGALLFVAGSHLRKQSEQP